eukprot:2093014-Pyramimonas_sp.AAC.1
MRRTRRALAVYTSVDSARGADATQGPPGADGAAEQAGAADAGADDQWDRAAAPAGPIGVGGADSG